MRSIVFAMMLSSTGCAAVFKGSTQPVRFEADAPEAVVEGNGQLLGKAPVTADIDRNGTANIKVSAPGYEDSYGRIKNKPDTAWWVVDIGTCAIPVLLCVPIVVDALTGAWMNVDPVYRVHLKPAPPTVPVVTSATTEGPKVPGH